MNPLTLSLNRMLAVVNRILHMDPQAQERLRPLAGRVLAVELEEIELPLRFTFTEHAIEPAATDAVADATVKAHPAALLSLALRGDQGSTGAVEFRGDVAVVHGVRKLLGELEIDWEEQLASVTGDILAHQLGNLARGAARWFTQSGRTVEQNLGEYLTEESRQLPGEPEVSGFLSGVDRLREDADRLAARLTRLERAVRDRGR